ncbi:MAG: recombinase RecT, partial [Planctomycetes bacterium]|nr:recombinase RecT [Planctomycetota bacterium]
MAVLPDEAKFMSEVSFAVQLINSSKQLKKCTQESALKAVVNVAQSGLTLNPIMRLAYLVPRTVRVGANYEVHACLDPSYQGLMKLVTDTGSVKSIMAQIVYEGDQIDIDYASDWKVRHKPAILL